MQLWQPPLPSHYLDMDQDDIAAAILSRKRELGSDLIILGHHYQQDEVVRFADFTGDSFKLSQLAAERVREAGAKYVVFCGVHFMAETADILTDEDVAVILPDMGAGCSMADMADWDQVVGAWGEIGEAREQVNQFQSDLENKFPSEPVEQAPADFLDRSDTGSLDDSITRSLGHSFNASPDHSITGSLDRSITPARLIPICYMNSSAAIKAFCGEHGGAVCTSSNAKAILEWALEGGDEFMEPGQRVKVLFLPDQHLGRNTAAEMGFDIASETALWDPRQTLGGLEPEDIERVTFLLWKGHCSVHKLFRPEHVDQVKAAWPDVTVMVHPECAHEVVERADMSGSTEGIIRAIETARPGSRWAIGTEVHLVHRLANDAKKRGVEVRILSDCQCLCTTMYRIDPPHLLWVLDNLAAGKVVNQIKVHPDARRHALVALNRMLDITAASRRAPASSSAAVV